MLFVVYQQIVALILNRGVVLGLLMYLFFDTETTGLPSGPTRDYQNWPRLVQLAWLLTDDDGKVHEKHSFIVQPNGYSIPKRATDIHGISTHQAYREGIPLIQVLQQFLIGTTYTDALICHNFDFDYHVMRGEMLRSNIPNFLQGYPMVCTMKSKPVIDYCQVMRGDKKRKWPKLSELYFLLFHEEMQGAHDAFVDARACKRCFFELKRLNVI